MKMFNKIHKNKLHENMTQQTSLRTTSTENKNVTMKCNDQAA